MTERFVVLDMDRTLLDSTEYSMALMDAFGLTTDEKIKATKKLAEQTGNSFDFLDYLMDTKQTRLEDIYLRMGQLTASQPESLLMPGVREFIHSLDDLKEPYGILTMGTPHNQRLKLATLRAILQKDQSTLPAEITNTPNKSMDFIRNRWNEARGGFDISPDLCGKLGGTCAELVVLVDDKQDNLTAKHPRIVAFHVPVARAEEAHTLQSVTDYLEQTAS